MNRIVDALGSEFSEPIRLVYFHRLGMDEAARVLGITAPQVKGRIAVALLRIGDAVMASGYDDAR